MLKQERKEKEENEVKFIKKVKPSPAKEVSGKPTGNEAPIRRGPACVPAGD